MRIYLAQMDFHIGETTINLNRVQENLVRAKSCDADLVCFPELSLTGYNLYSYGFRQSDMDKLYNKQDIPLLQRMVKDINVNTIIGLIDRDIKTGLYYNSALYISGKGDISKHYKHFLWGNEAKLFTRGNQYDVFQTEFGTLSMLICYDLNFPETARKQALLGAELIIVLGAWGMRDIERWKTFIRSRAAENLCYIAGVNRSGQEGDLIFCGNSSVVKWDGSILAALGTDPGFLFFDLDLGSIEQAREQFTYFQDGQHEIGILNWKSNVSKTAKLIDK